MAALANQYNHSSCSPVTQDKGHISRLDIRDPLCPRPTPHSQSVFLLPHWSPLSTPLAHSQAPPTPRSFPALPLGPWLILFLDNCHLLLHPCGPKPRSTRVRPFPAAPGTVGQRRGGLLWVTRGFSNCAFSPRSHCACRAMTARRRRSPSRRPATQSRLAPPAPLACFPMCYLRKASAGGGSAAENPIQDVMTTKRPKKKVIRS